MNINDAKTQRVSVIDTHTGGEPTRVVVAGEPDLGPGPVSDRLRVFRERSDTFRSAVVNEPRGSDVMVGALVTASEDPNPQTGIIFFNNVGFLGMCGHGTIGVGAALAHLGWWGPGEHPVETPVGTVGVTLEDRNTVSFENVKSFRKEKGVCVDVPGLGPVVGDVAWGGNWFFLVNNHEETMNFANIERLTDVAWRIRQALSRAGVSGDDGAEIDHVELFGPSEKAGSRSFVLCPGRAYDRSPCGTGTSAKLACLADDGKLGEGETWLQESIIGSVFEASYRRVEGGIVPRIRGKAYVTAETTLIIDPADPFAWGIRP